MTACHSHRNDRCSGAKIESKILGRARAWKSRGRLARQAVRKEAKGEPSRGGGLTTAVTSPDQSLHRKRLLCHRWQAQIQFHTRFGRVTYESSRGKHWVRACREPGNVQPLVLIGPCRPATALPSSSVCIASIGGQAAHNHSRMMTGWWLTCWLLSAVVCSGLADGRLVLRGLACARSRWRRGSEIESFEAGVFERRGPENSICTGEYENAVARVA